MHPDVKLAANLARDLDKHFEAVVLAYQDRLFRFATRFTGNPQDGREIAQDAFVRAYRALRTYDRARIAGLALGPWLYRISLNTARNRVRGKRLEMTPLEAAARAAIPASEHPDAHAERASVARELEAALADLPERYRGPLVLRYVEDLAYAEIAAVLELPMGTVKGNIHRGLALLRERLASREGLLV